MYWSQTSDWSSENVCCELERTWNTMNLHEVEQAVADAIVGGLPVTNRLLKLKGLKEWVLITRLIKL